jgi:hypothetical protein
VNQLVRGRIDFEGFRGWYSDLPPGRRRALTYLLCGFAHQAGVSFSTWGEALAASGLPASAAVVRQLLVAGRGEYSVFRLFELVEAVPEEDLPTAFRLLVYRFGTAEGDVYRASRRSTAATGGTAASWTSGWCGTC